MTNLDDATLADALGSHNGDPDSERFAASTGCGSFVVGHRGR